MNKNFRLTNRSLNSHQIKSRQMRSTKNIFASFSSNCELTFLRMSQNTECNEEPVCRAPMKAT